MKKTQENKIITGAEAILLCLIEEKVNTIFGYPGGAIMPLYDELFNYSHKLKHILVRHEQGAAHAAQAYSMATGKEGICFATSGPGATNLITGIANAFGDSVPMVFVTAQVASPFLGSDAFQETDVVGISMPITKWNFQITKAEDIPYAFAKAFYISNTGRKGPVLIDITKDAQVQKIEFSYQKYPQIRSYNPYPAIDFAKVDEAAKLINSSKKPLILAGHGIMLSRAEKELINLAEKAGIPVAWTLLGISAFPSGHPLAVGMLGMHGNYGPNIKTNEADLIIGLGMRFDDRVTGNLSKYAKQAKIIHVEIDPAEIDKNVKTDVAINSDLKSALNALIPLVNGNTHDEWLQSFRNCDKKEFEKVIEFDIHPKSEKIRMGEVVHKISEKTKGEAIVCTDVGQHQMITARYFKFNHPNTHITSGGLGTMGFGLPAAIGAKIGKPNREVILFVGDGGFQMNIQELGTIMEQKLAVKIVILNNNFLGMVRQWQQMFFEDRLSSTNMPTPDFVKIAEAYHIKGRVVAKREDLDNAIDEMLNSKEAFLLEIKVEKESNVFPMIVPGASVSDVRLE